MKKSALSRWRGGSWIIPLAVVAMCFTLSACGGDDGCQDKGAESSENDCARSALRFACGPTDADFNPDGNICSLSSCRVCPTFTPFREGTPSPGPTNTPVPFPPGYHCDLQVVINTPRPQPSVTPDLNALCQAQGVTRICGSPNFSFEASTGLCIISGCANCNFPDDVF